MNRPTDERLAEIRERCDKATEGPWKAEIEIDGIYAGRHTVVVSSKRSSMLTRRVVNVSQTRKCVENEENNIEFIAHAREDIPLLLSEVKALRKLIEDITIIASENRYNASEQVLLQILMRIEEDDE